MIELLLGTAAVLGFAAWRLSRPPHGVRGLVEEGRLSSPYMVQRTATHYHRGIDVRAARGTPLRAVNNGYVRGIYVDCERKGYGNSVLIQHDDGTLGFYAHLQRFADLSEGQRVRRGQVVGYVGTTDCGSARPGMAPHVHFEVHLKVVETPGGWPIIAENTPARMDPVEYLERVGVPISDRPLAA